MTQQPSKPTVGSIRRVPARVIESNGIVGDASRSLIQSTLNWCHWIFTTDFCPKWNKISSRLKTPLAILVITSLVTFFSGLFLAPQSFLLFAATVCVITIGIAYPWVAIFAVDCNLTFAKGRMSEGETTYPKLNIRNRWPIPIWGLAFERGFHSFQSSPLANRISVALAHVPGWSRTEFTWEFTPLRRGVYPNDKVVVTCSFPFGLWTARKEVPVERQVVVWPASVQSEPKQWNRHQGIRPLCASSTAAGNDLDVTAIRPYRDGDLMRDVHWSTTARMNELMVKERQKVVTSHVRIVVDVRGDIESLPSDRGIVALDWAIRITTGVCEAYYHQRTPFSLEFGSSRFEIRSGRDRVNLLDELAAFGDFSSLKGAGKSLNVQPPKSHVQITLTINRLDDDAFECFIDTASVAEQTNRWRIYPRLAQLKSKTELQHECHRMSLSFLGRQEFNCQDSQRHRETADVDRRLNYAG